MEAIQKQRLSCALLVSNLGYYRVAVAGGGSTACATGTFGTWYMSEHSFIHSFI